MPQSTATKPVTLPNPDEECDAIGIHLEESREPGMRDLKEELASLRIERNPTQRRRWGLWIFVLVLLAAASAAGLYVARNKSVLTSFAAVEV